ncbi:unnamed protein product [Heligmosomoides polygyrus]|uniref:Pyr_redox_2 domain-containing protein n=1 Tax=Heligmosomoides polygyrus TaxID=6339 RepID=A0A183FSJ2_HELPZ|nr:unnamed protein product [Heligmosomoides polygyrus]
MVAYSSLVVLTPIKQSPNHNVVVIHREEGIDGDKLLHVAGGPHTGIIINKLCKHVPGDYVSFMMRILKQMQQEFAEIQRVDIEFKIVSEEEQVAIPDAAQYGGTTEEEVQKFLAELEALGLVTRMGDEYLRVDTRNVDAVARPVHGIQDQPTVAIVTCLFVEKQAVDALIEDRSILHKMDKRVIRGIYLYEFKLGTTAKEEDEKINAAFSQGCSTIRTAYVECDDVGGTRTSCFIESLAEECPKLLGNFQNIEHVFVVGVGGAVPHFTDAKRHARLGDVIVSASRPDAYIYSYDMIVDRKTEAFSGFAVRKWNPVDHVISKIVEDGGEELLCKWNEMTDEAVRRLHDAGGDFDFSQPSADSDVLALPVGGGNVLRALDAGFDSVIAAISGSRIDSWSLIRGIADYQHGLSRASKLWQAHAAARAAALLRVVVERLPSP